MPSTDSKKHATKTKSPDDFESVAKRLGCDTDTDKFLKKLGRSRGRSQRVKPLKGETECDTYQQFGLW